MPLTTGFKNSSGTDLGSFLVEKSYLIDRYPELANTFKQSGLWTWGDNTYGQLGDGTRSTKISPVQTIAGGAEWKQVSASVRHVAAIKTDGTLWTWGFNGGQLGDNTTIDKSSPVQTIAGGTNWKDVSCGTGHTAAIKTDGTLWTFGNNASGQLGDGTNADKSSPVQTIASGTNWKQVSCGGTHTAAIKTDGTLWTWGGNAYGMLGSGDTTDRNSPIQTFAGGTNWKQVSAGEFHAGAIKTDGTLWMWGRNTRIYGKTTYYTAQLGDGTTNNKSIPVQTIASGTNWKQVSCGGSHTAAIKTDGTLWMWGRKTYASLTNNTSSPVQTAAGGTNWKSVSSGTTGSAFIKTDGTLWYWGAQQGDGVLDNYNTPVQTSIGGTNWRSVAQGQYYVVTIRDDSSDLL